LRPLCKTVNKTLLKYDIQIQGLENKRYEYDFEGDDKFFEAFEQDLIYKGKFDAHIILDKSSTMLQLMFEIKGKVELECDRSLEKFDEPVDVKEKYIFKFGERKDLISDEIEMIPFGTPSINVAQHIYDFIALTIPMRKVHPKYRDDDDNEEEASLIYQTNVEDIEEEEKEKDIDPRWAKLKNLGF
jgi:uncharacterized metal-binding protein YceD (DUF177 family)